MPKTSTCNPHSSPGSSVGSISSQRCATKNVSAPTRQKQTRRNDINQPRPPSSPAETITTTSVGMPSLQRYPSRATRFQAKDAPPIIVRRNTQTASGNLSPIADSPPIQKNKKRVASTYGNDLDYSDDDNDFLLSDEDLDLDAKCIEYMDTKKKGSGRRRGNLILGGPEQKDTSKMMEDERREYRKTRKEYTDRQRFERMRHDPLDFLPSDQFTGDCTPTLCTESEVQAAPLLWIERYLSTESCGGG